MTQVCLFDSCECGAPVEVAGRCARCYARRWHDLRHFGGFREAVLERDGRRCRGCKGREGLIVHHRAPVQDQAWMITLCVACHAIIHHLQSIRYWMPDILVDLWKEQHPSRPVQLQLGPERETAGSSFESRPFFTSLPAAAWLCRTQPQYVGPNRTQERLLGVLGSNLFVALQRSAPPTA